MQRERLVVGQVLISPDSGEKYEITALGKRYVLVEVKTPHGAHEFPRRYEEIQRYEIYGGAA